MNYNSIKDVFQNIILFKLDIESILNFSSSNSYFQNEVCNDTFWKLYFQKKFNLNITWQVKIPWILVYKIINTKYNPNNGEFVNKNLNKILKKYDLNDYIDYITKVINVKSVNQLRKYKSLTCVKFDNDFDQKVDQLPKKLTHLTFGYHFNQKVDHLPEKLTRLTFGHHFDQTVDHLPSTLIDLTLSYTYKNPNKLSLPKNTKLRFSPY